MEHCQRQEYGSVHIGSVCEREGVLDMGVCMHGMPGSEVTATCG